MTSCTAVSRYHNNISASGRYEAPRLHPGHLVTGHGYLHSPMAARKHCFQEGICVEIPEVLLWVLTLVHNELLSLNSFTSYRQDIL